uniref:glycosyltransferase family 2 protein n=1 Tax=Thaumasiovibrio occultus TaxID=1891184 RepID=UPI000B362821|nr:glycosyltransferase family 2 protein [Thaumasiovibrio occultus]
MSSSVRVAAVIVHYHPTEQDWENTRYIGQFLPVVVVDNSEASSNSEADDTITVLRNGDNLGIATALNIGIDYWQQRGMQWCFLFDQDSKITSTFIDDMLKPAMARAQQRSEGSHHSLTNIAAFLPRYFANNLHSFGAGIQVSPWRIKRVSVDQITNTIDSPTLLPVSYGISSGSLVNLAAYEQIGPHHEPLFIDFVDIEWGLRANAKGFQVLMNVEVTLSHELGVEPLHILGKRIVNHSPLRHYYYFRNLCQLLKMAHVPAVWKLAELGKLPIRFGLYSLFTPAPYQHIKAMLGGLCDGLQNKTGKKDESPRYR